MELGYCIQYNKKGTDLSEEDEKIIRLKIDKQCQMIYLKVLTIFII